MNPEVLRAQLTGLLDGVSGRWILGARTRAIAAGLRGWLQVAKADVLTEMGSFLPELSLSSEAEDMDHQAMAAAMGIDLSKIDWAKVAQIVQFVINILSGLPHPVQGTRAGCEDECRCCAEAACHSLQAAQLCLAHVHSCQQ